MFSLLVDTIPNSAKLHKTKTTAKAKQNVKKLTMNRQSRICLLYMNLIPIKHVISIICIFPSRFFFCSIGRFYGHFCISKMLMLRRTELPIWMALFYRIDFFVRFFSQFRASIAFHFCQIQLLSFSVHLDAIGSCNECVLIKRSLRNCSHVNISLKIAIRTVLSTTAFHGWC